MVFFICDNCGESLKKNQVQKHSSKCKNGSFSCMDCQVVFTINNYDHHIKCISEDEKYGGANYTAKINKGEVKQDSWVNQVRAAIKFVNDPQLKGLLRKIQGYTNIPRKESKFINFLQNSLNYKNYGLCKKAWEAIKDEAEKLKNKRAEKCGGDKTEVIYKEVEEEKEIEEKKEVEEKKEIEEEKQGEEEENQVEEEKRVVEKEEIIEEDQLVEEKQIEEENQKRISDIPLKSILKKKKKEEKNKNGSKKFEENLIVRSNEPKMFPTRIVFNDSDDE
uniref:Zinc finger C2H2 LYAR-type domain-containing protein n=1 Tax=Meloidogyne incognita TaxID=6306 RepID=A0A914LDF7_MELIC